MRKSYTRDIRKVNFKSGKDLRTKKIDNKNINQYVPYFDCFLLVIVLGKNEKEG